MEFGWTKEEVNAIMNVLQLIGVCGAKIQYTPPIIPSDKETLDIKSAFSKIVTVVLNRRMNQEWTREWPTKSGSYWFYGYSFTPIKIQGDVNEEPELRFVEVRNTSVPNQLAYITREHFLSKAEGANGWWIEATFPELPKI